MTVGRFERIVALLVLLAGGAFACRIPGPKEQIPTLPTPTYSPATTGPASVTVEVYPTETVQEPTPPSELPEYEGITWLASEVIRVGEPHEGWQDYQVRLVYENTSGKATTAALSKPILQDWIVSTAGPVKLITQEGYTYEEGFDWHVHHVSPQNCWHLNTGVIPPGFRVRGAVLYNPDTGGPCISEIVIQFSIGETLHPDTLIIPPYRPIALSTPPPTLIYGPIDPSSKFYSLPATISMGKMRVTMEQPIRTSEGNIVIHLLYQNSDLATDVDVRNPIAAVIDSGGYLSVPASTYWELYDPTPFEMRLQQYDDLPRYCRDTVKEPVGVGFTGWLFETKQLGPLQEASFQTCVVANPTRDPAIRHFLVACGWPEEVEEPFLPFIEDAECYVYELDIVK